MITTQNFAITNFIDYAIVDEIGDTSGMDVEIIHTVAATHQVKITSYIDDSGAGWETREITH